tara:strand:- start:337 stop:1926 length:1590 start_codon:yes stop_codon:yes gene_type:complete
MIGKDKRGDLFKKLQNEKEWDKLNMPKEIFNDIMKDIGIVDKSQKENIKIEFIDIRITDMDKKSKQIKRLEDKSDKEEKYMKKFIDEEITIKNTQEDNSEMIKKTKPKRRREIVKTMFQLHENIKEFQVDKEDLVLEDADTYHPKRRYKRIPQNFSNMRCIKPYKSKEESLKNKFDLSTLEVSEGMYIPMSEKNEVIDIKVSEDLEISYEMTKKEDSDNDEEIFKITFKDNKNKNKIKKYKKYKKDTETEVEETKDSVSIKVDEQVVVDFIKKDGMEKELVLTAGSLTAYVTDKIAYHQYHCLQTNDKTNRYLRYSHDPTAKVNIVIRIDIESVGVPSGSYYQLTLGDESGTLTPMTRHDDWNEYIVDDNLKQITLKTLSETLGEITESGILLGEYPYISIVRDPRRVAISISDSTMAKLLKIYDEKDFPISTDYYSSASVDGPTIKMMPTMRDDDMVELTNVPDKVPTKDEAATDLDTNESKFVDINNPVDEDDDGDEGDEGYDIIPLSPGDFLRKLNFYDAISSLNN